MRLDARELIRAAKDHGAVAAPAHPGRFGIGLSDYISQGESFEGIHIAELLNGGSRKGENERAQQLCEEYGYLGIGGSDAHLTSHVGACLTKFPANIVNEAELVEALLSGQFEPVWVGGLLERRPGRLEIRKRRRRKDTRGWEHAGLLDTSWLPPGSPAIATEGTDLW